MKFTDVSAAGKRLTAPLASRRRRRLFWLVGLALVCLFRGETALCQELPGRVAAVQPAAAIAAEAAKPAGRMTLLLSLLWEGEQVKPLNLAAIAAFRREFPTVKFVQFLNPAYFTKPEVEVAKVREAMATVIQAEDTIGLHLHGWKSLIEASGVGFRSYPTFWGQVLSEQECQRDCGHEVPISIYTQAEIEAIVKHGLKVLTDAGFSQPQAFMAGGWMGAPHVLEAVMQQGISYDFSPVPPALVAEELRYFPLRDWLEHLWAQVQAHSQPLVYYTSRGLMTQVPQNGAAVDYRNSAEIFQWYENAVKEWQNAPETHAVLHLGLYQETAFTYLPRLKSALQKILTHSAEEGLPLVLFESLKDLIPAKGLDASSAVSWHNPPTGTGPAPVQ